MTTEKQFQADVRKVPQLGVASGITTLEEEFLAHMVLPTARPWVSGCCLKWLRPTTRDRCRRCCRRREPSR